MDSNAVFLLETVNFAAEKHRNQRRKDAEKTPYINHPIGVARILSHEAGITDIVVLQAALLHDTLEDTDTKPEELETKFGQIVAGIVQEVTDVKSLPKAERKRLQVEHAPHCSHQAKLVKLADKLYNLRDLNRCTPVDEETSPPPEKRGQLETHTGPTEKAKEGTVWHEEQVGRHLHHSQVESYAADGEPTA
ncbi:guanosine-3',5'-bis(diphosphate) 3'-pyrophosphohydrolase MESH1 isoform X1 [Phycodurus eques]|uniref:guanosine-3',5'-bis(diphosphate) 3'-pyrophosphohydrolase MESH1 isoform X1 n=1 Tax=Phycodurus eques TaxID=693459 RepID=UPI002ACE5BEF|nr:guanosine-3',5'-bis(diphosphate) 3'-pyrophosphohydrolase MESH1 isoform X1 [Phycodurus eques]